MLIFYVRNSNSFLKVKLSELDVSETRYTTWNWQDFPNFTQFMQWEMLLCRPLPNIRGSPLFHCHSPFKPQSHVLWSRIKLLGAGFIRPFQLEQKKREKSHEIQIMPRQTYPNFFCDIKIPNYTYYDTFILNYLYLCDKCTLHWVSVRWFFNQNDVFISLKSCECLVNNIYFLASIWIDF